MSILDYSLLTWYIRTASFKCLDRHTVIACMNTAVDNLLINELSAVDDNKQLMGCYLKR